MTGCVSNLYNMLLNMYVFTLRAPFKDTQTVVTVERIQFYGDAVRLFDFILDSHLLQP